VLVNVSVKSSVLKVLLIWEIWVMLSPPSENCIAQTKRLQLFKHENIQVSVKLFGCIIFGE